MCPTDGKFWEPNSLSSQVLVVHWDPGSLKGKSWSCFEEGWMSTHQTRRSCLRSESPTCPQAPGKHAVLHCSALSMRRSLGCLDPQCVLCEHNPHRRCNVNFAPKYLVNDILKAKCEAPIRVEVIDRTTGVPLGEDISDVHLEVSFQLHIWHSLLQIYSFSALCESRGPLILLISCCDTFSHLLHASHPPCMCKACTYRAAAVQQMVTRHS